MFQIPSNLVDLLQVLFQAKEVLFACQSGHVTSAMEVNDFFAYRHGYQGRQASVNSTNGMDIYVFFQSSP